jgi:hypothetical protein
MKISRFLLFAMCASVLMACEVDEHKAGRLRADADLSCLAASGDGGNYGKPGDAAASLREESAVAARVGDTAGATRLAAEARAEQKRVDGSPPPEAAPNYQARCDLATREFNKFMAGR